MIGGCGFLGTALSAKLDCDIVSRQGPLTHEAFFSPEIFCQYDIVINLSGRSIDTWPWTEKTKEDLVLSRTKTIERLCRTAHQTQHHPWLIQASGISYYGLFEQSIHQQSEYDPPEESYTFMQTLTFIIEKSLKAYPGLTTTLRIAPVLAKDQGLLPKLLLLSKLGIHMVPGSGLQTLPWIALPDFVDGCLWVIAHNITGPVNIVAPEAITINDFYQEVKNRQGGLKCRLPKWLYSIPLGQMSQLILMGTKATPLVLENNGYKFQYRHIKKLLKDFS